MQEQLHIFQSLFKGREDIFAVRWEKSGKSGYMPAYDVNWQEYAQHTAKGGSFETYTKKKRLPLTDQKLITHLSGHATLGIYPLLETNTSWFIAADFDQGTSKRTWIEECRLFMAACAQHELPVYLERSRSGKGGHVWLFFEQPVPAAQSRRLFTGLLRTAGIITPLDKGSNFDRLFPNQDFHSGKGYGNLIALPLQGKSLENKNACFIDPTTEEPFPDQWDFLKTIKKISQEQFDAACTSIDNNSASSFILPANQPNDGKVRITLSNEVTIDRHGLNGILAKYLAENLNFLNTDYIIKKKSGKNTYDVPIYFKCIKDHETSISFPKGIIGRLLRFCKQEQIEYDLRDQRMLHEPVLLKSDIPLYDYQKTAVDISDKKNFGIITAPPGTGKTIIALAIIARKKQPALIVVHRKQIFEQWMERIESFLGIPKHRIGKIESGKCVVGQELTVAMIQSLHGNTLPADLYGRFGTVIVDECHHIPANTFAEVIQKFNSYYLYGFTATPFRKGGDEKLIFIYLGNIIHEVALPQTENTRSGELSVIIRSSPFFSPFDAKTDIAEALLSVLIHDTKRNELIVKDITSEAVAGRKVLVLTERKAHVEILKQYLRGNVETIAITGDDAAYIRKAKLNQIAEGNFQVLLTTGQFLGEGMDIRSLDCLVLAYPFSFEGKLTQYIGRVQRTAVKPIIYDYRDNKVEYLEKQFKQRNKYYRKLTENGQLKPFDELVLLFDGDRFFLQSLVNSFSIEDLDLPVPVDKFLPDVCWKIRVLQYDETGVLTCEIIDYRYSRDQSGSDLLSSFYFQGIEKVKFRSINTAAFLSNVVLKTAPALQPKIKMDSPEHLAPEQVILKTMKVPFSSIRFLNGAVSFPLFIQEINGEVIFEIVNPAVRPEFGAITAYFVKILKKKNISVEIAIRFCAEGIISSIAKSEDVDTINDKLIESVRFEFIKQNFFKPKDSRLDGPATLEGIAGHFTPAAQQLFASDQDLLDHILNAKNSRHYQHLQYLSSRHEAGILKLRFVLQPFSFLFLLAGEKKYHVIWETLDSEEATYIWHSEKSREALRNLLDSIEEVITGIKKNGRQEFLKLDHLNFSRILHDYSDAKKGFIAWKGLLDERMM